MKSCLLIVLKEEAKAFSVMGEICGRDGVIHVCDCEHGVIEATLDCEHVAAVRALDGVAYVRPFMTFAGAA